MVYKLKFLGCLDYLIIRYSLDRYVVFKVQITKEVLIIKNFFVSGDGEIRTHDPLLARQVLSQLSYTPVVCAGSHLLSHTVSSAVPSAAQVLTIVFGMGTGVSPERIATSDSYSAA